MHDVPNAMLAVNIYHSRRMFREYTGRKILIRKWTLTECTRGGKKKLDARNLRGESETIFQDTENRIQGVAGL